MYGKIFDSIYDGTLVEDWRALITFQQMIVLSDADGVVDMTASAISRRTSIPIEHIKAGLEILEQPDPESRTPDEDGRRIVRLDDHKTWGWYLVNHNKYKGLQDSDTVREQNRIRKQRQRAKQKESRDVTDGHTKSRHIDIDTNTDKETLEIDQKLWKEWMTVRKQKKAVNSETAIKALKTRLEKIVDSGKYTANDAIKIAIENSWKSVDITWLDNLEQNNAKTNSRTNKPETGADVFSRQLAQLSAGGRQN